jgi:hypothetical protein
MRACVPDGESQDISLETLKLLLFALAQKHIITPNARACVAFFIRVNEIASAVNNARKALFTPGPNVGPDCLIDAIAWGIRQRSVDCDGGFPHAEK